MDKQHADDVQDQSSMVLLTSTVYCCQAADTARKHNAAS
jgi:hypothetical protein